MLGTGPAAFGRRDSKKTRCPSITLLCFDCVCHVSLNTALHTVTESGAANGHKYDRQLMSARIGWPSNGRTTATCLHRCHSAQLKWTFETRSKLQ